MYKKIVFSLVFVFLSAFILFAAEARAAIIGPPLIISIGEGKEGIAKPLITGLTPAGTEVLVYLDGEFAGLASINSKGTPTDNFYYQSSEVLSNGGHLARVVARSKNSTLLSEPREAGFEIKSSAVGKIPSAPTLLAPNVRTITAKVKPLITALSENNTRLHLYIDGVYNGKTDFKNHPSGTANFAYRPFLNLTAGWHTAWAVSENKQGLKSGSSNILRFQIERPMPAPILLKSLTRQQAGLTQPLVVGLAKNNSLIRVFVDKKFAGQFKVNNHPSGAANFSYSFSSPLRLGRHLIYVTAADDRGKESSWSNFTFFTVVSLVKPTVQKEAAAEQSGQAARIEEKEKKEPMVVITPDQGEIEDEACLTPEGCREQNKEKVATSAPVGINAENEAGKEQMGAGAEEGNDKFSALTAETGKEKGKFKVSLFIFLGFLLGIIAWIIWVNRELIKEKRAAKTGESQDKPESKDSDNESPPAGGSYLE